MTRTRPISLLVLLAMVLALPVHGADPVIAPADAQWSYTTPFTQEVIDISGGPADPDYREYTAPTSNATGPLSYQWYKDERPITGATQPTLRVQPLVLASGGRYAVRVASKLGSQTFPMAHLLVLHHAVEGTLSIKEGVPLVLPAPAGSRGSCPMLWFRDGEPVLADTETTISFNGAFRRTAARAIDSGEWVLKSGSPAAEIVLATWQVNVRPLPQFVKSGFFYPDRPFPPSLYRVGSRVEDEVPVQDALAITAAGLPPGLQIRLLTLPADNDHEAPWQRWTLVGIPYRAGTYRVTLTAKNSVGSSAPWQMEMVVYDTPDNYPGSYVGIADAQFLGGFSANGKTLRLPSAVARLEMTARGTFTLAVGSMRCVGISDSGYGSAYFGTYPAIDRLTGAISNTRYFIDTVLGYSSDTINIWLRSEGDPDDAFQWFTVYKTYNAALPFPASEAGRYHVPLSVTSKESEGPRALARAIWTLSPRGTATGAIRLDDGAVLTCSAPCTQSHGVPFSINYGRNPGLPDFAGRQFLYSLANVKGWFMTENGYGTVSMNWVRKPTTGRTFPSGLVESLDGYGLRYLPPNRNAVVMDLPLLEGNADFHLSTFDATGVDDEFLSGPLSIGLSAAVRQPTGIGTVPVQPLTLKIDRAHGTFTGTARLTSAHPVTGKPFVRTAAFFGILTPQLDPPYNDDYNIGSAGFLIPALPNEGSSQPAALIPGQIILNRLLH